MGEMVKTYMLDNPEVMIPMDRAEFYDEQVKAYKETGKPTRAVDIVNVFLFNELGELFVQKRSMEKNHNPGLLDKSIGGHVNEGDEPDYTVMVETVQELQVPSFVLRTDIDFQKTHGLLEEYLSTVAVVQHIDTEFYPMKKMLGGEEVVISNRTHIYAGVYGGRVKTVDREAKGILQYTLKDLRAEMKKYPDIFTYDLRFYEETYRSQLEQFVKSFLSK